MHLPFAILFVLSFAIIGCGDNATYVTWRGCPDDEVPAVFGFTCCEQYAKFWAKPEKKAELCCPLPPSRYPPDPDVSCPDAGTPDAGAGADDGGNSGDLDGSADASSAKICEGDCVPMKPPSGWDEPMLFWLGPPDKAPDCPALAPEQRDLGWADLQVSNECPACACDPPDVSCKMPATFTVHSELCSNLPGGIDTSFDPPSSWGGTCTTENQIPVGQECPMGSGIPCVRSLTIGPLEVVTSACAVHEDPAPIAGPPAPTWGALGRMCRVSTNLDLGVCEGGKLDCVSPAEFGFRHCVHKEGDADCDDEGYTEKYVVYKDFIDQRTCSDCSCGPPEGGYCSANARLYNDAACIDLMALLPIDSLSSPCFDLVPPGRALAGKEITDINYIPGTCAPTGGELSGTVELDGATTVCCLPSQPPVP